MQRALIQYKNPANYQLVKEALELAGRTDLIGYDRRCLIRPQNSGSHAFRKPQTAGNAGQQHSGRTVFESKKKKKTIRNVHKKKTGR